MADYFVTAQMLFSLSLLPNCLVISTISVTFILNLNSNRRTISFNLKTVSLMTLEVHIASDIATKGSKRFYVPVSSIDVRKAMAFYKLCAFDSRNML